MPVKNDGESDGEGDVSGAESDHSVSSHGQDHESSAEEVDEPDSDDFSDMDESECERRRIDCLDNLSKCTSGVEPEILCEIFLP